MDIQEQAGAAPFWRRLTLWQQFAVIMLPLTLLSMAIAVGSMAIHQQAMRAELPQEVAKTATNPALELTLVAPLVLVPPLLFAVAALWFGARQIVRPLQQLELRAAALAGGDFESIKEPVGGISEVRHLQHELTEMSRKVQAAQEGLHDYIGAITAAQEEERMRLAHELHDDTIQAVIALKQRVQLAGRSTMDPGARGVLSELETLAEQTIENLRRLTHALRPIYLEDLGLVAALQMLVREAGQAKSLHLEFRQTGRERRLSSDAELVLYRIAQEALNNVTRHSKAGRAALEVTYGENEVRLEVKDNGVGFAVPSSPTDLAPSGHFGLLGMRERAELIGAQFRVTSQGGQGTEVSVRLPV
ncbi:MAG TPA: ATP-binding protein [Anaerolineales bacterium]